MRWEERADTPKTELYIIKILQVSKSKELLLETANNSPNIEILDHHYVIDIITQHHVPGKELNEGDIHCYGAYILDEKSKTIKKITSKITLAATGGAGHVYKNTTNPTIATGDGIAFVARAKGKVSICSTISSILLLYTIRLTGCCFLFPKP